MDAARDSASNRDFAPPSHVEDYDGFGPRFDAFSGSAGNAERYDNYGGGGGGGGERGGRSRFAPPTHGYDDYERYANAPPPFDGDRNGPARVDTAVVMIYGINHRDYNPQRIFNICCCYGNVLKVSEATQVESRSNPPVLF